VRGGPDPDWWLYALVLLAVLLATLLAVLAQRSV
jgi:hypothetical protein